MAYKIFEKPNKLGNYPLKNVFILLRDRFDTCLAYWTNDCVETTGTIVPAGVLINAVRSVSYMSLRNFFNGIIGQNKDTGANENGRRSGELTDVETKEFYRDFIYYRFVEGLGSEATRKKMQVKYNLRRTSYKFMVRNEEAYLAKHEDFDPYAELGLGRDGSVLTDIDEDTFLDDGDDLWDWDDPGGDVFADDPWADVWSDPYGLDPYAYDPYGGYMDPYGGTYGNSYYPSYDPYGGSYSHGGCCGGSYGYDAYGGGSYDTYGYDCGGCYETYYEPPPTNNIYYNVTINAPTYNSYTTNHDHYTTNNDYYTTNNQHDHYNTYNDYYTTNNAYDYNTYTTNNAYDYNNYTTNNAYDYNTYNNAYTTNNAYDYNSYNTTNNQYTDNNQYNTWNNTHNNAYNTSNYQTNNAYDYNTYNNQYTNNTQSNQWNNYQTQYQQPYNYSQPMAYGY